MTIANALIRANLYGKDALMFASRGYEFLACVAAARAATLAAAAMTALEAK